MNTVDSTAASPAVRQPLLTVPAVTGIVYTLCWVIGLSIGAPSPKVNASGADLISAITGHETAMAAMFVFTEGLPAVGLAIVSLALARAARRSGALTAARTAGSIGPVAAALSLTMCVLGVALTRSTQPGTMHGLFETVQRIDGVKMFTLAVLGVAGAMSGLLPTWLRYVGIALAVAIIASGIGFLLLIPGVAALAYVSGPLLLLFITGSGIVLGRTAR